MIAQDVGSAIKGPERGDIYFGSGEKAGKLAGMTKHPGSFFVLLPAPPTAPAQGHEVRRALAMANDREGRTTAKLRRARRRRAAVADEERALWEHTARSLKPFKGKKRRVHAALEEPTTARAAPRKPRPPSPRRRNTRRPCAAAFETAR